MARMGGGGGGGRAKPWLQRQEKRRGRVGQGRTSKDAAFGQPVMQRLAKRDVLDMAAATMGIKGKSIGDTRALHSPSHSQFDMPKKAQGFKNPLA